MRDPDPGKFLNRGYQGAVYLHGSDAQPWVVKQPMGGRLALRLRKAMLRREFAAYQRLTGIPGVPLCFGLRDDGSLVLEYVAGDAYRESLPALRDRDRFFRELLSQILSVHAVGVAHADLKRRGNILVSPEGHPLLLDFGSAVRRKASGSWWNRFLFRQACRMDLNAWVKLKYRGHYATITQEDARYYQPTAIEGAARVIRRVWRKVTGRRFRKAWRERHQRGQHG